MARSYILQGWKQEMKHDILPEHPWSQYVDMWTFPCLHAALKLIVFLVLFLSVMFFFMLYCLCFLIPAYTACTAIYWALMLRANPRPCAPASQLGTDFKASRIWFSSGTQAQEDDWRNRLCCCTVAGWNHMLFFVLSLLVCFHTQHFLTVLIAGATREHQHPLWNLKGLELTWPTVLWSGIFGFTGKKKLNVHCVTWKKKSVDNFDCIWHSGQSQQE